LPSHGYATELLIPGMFLCFNELHILYQFGMIYAQVANEVHLITFFNMAEEIMKRQILFLILVFFITGIGSQAAGQDRFSSPSTIGILGVGVHQDASQLSHAGLGPGVELFLRYNVSSWFSITGATGLLTVTDDLLQTKQVRTIMIPSVELWSELRFAEWNWFQPFIHFGTHFFGASTEVFGAGSSQSTGHEYQLNVFGGLGTEVNLGSPRYSFYFSADYRYAVKSSASPKPQYWVAKAGIVFPLGLSDSIGRRPAQELEMPEFIDAYLMEEEKASAYGDARSDQSAEWIERIEAVESSLLLGLREIRDEIRSNTQQMAALSLKVQDPPESKAQTIATFDVGQPFFTQYQAALELFQQKTYSTAAEEFTRLVSANPGHVLESNCHYWIGECYYALSRHHEAIAAFNRVFDYNDSFKTDDALLMRGQSYYNMGNQDLAKSSFQELVDRFPNSEYIPYAKRYLKLM